MRRCIKLFPEARLHSKRSNNRAICPLHFNASLRSRNKSNLYAVDAVSSKLADRRPLTDNAAALVHCVLRPQHILLFNLTTRVSQVRSGTELCDSIRVPFRIHLRRYLIAELLLLPLLHCGTSEVLKEFHRDHEIAKYCGYPPLFLVSTSTAVMITGSMDTRTLPVPRCLRTLIRF